MAAALGLCVAVAALYFVWTHRTRTIGPSVAAVRELLIAQLPAYTTINSIRLGHIELLQAGDPSIYRASFDATALLTSNLYRQAGQEGDIVFLELAAQQGSPTPLTGSALLEGNTRAGWTGQVTLDSSVLGEAMPREAFQARQVIVRGSAEETEYQAAKAEEDRQAQLAAEQAADAESRHRAALLQREQERIAAEEAAQARLRQQRAAEEAAAERARLEAAAQEQARREADTRDRQQREEVQRREVERLRQQELPISPGRIPKGQNAVVTLSGTLRTDAVSVEDRFDAFTAEDIIVNGRVLVPAGATMRGVVAGVQSATRKNRTAKLDLAFDQLTIGSRSFPMRAKASVTGRGLKGDAAKVGIGAGIGAVIGGILAGGKGAAIGSAVGGGGTLAATEGQEIDLPAGSQLQIKFDAPLDLK